MYWFSLFNLIFLLLSACNSRSEIKDHENEGQLDIPAYFNNEIESLNKLNPHVIKTVNKDSISESKELQIADWKKELSNFTAVDLNKGVYRGTYKKDSVDNTVTYTFHDPNVDLSVVQIIYEDAVPSHFMIKRISKNLLYNTEEQLIYNKDKSYTVDKVQKVKLLGTQHYHIEGIIQ